MSSVIPVKLRLVPLFPLIFFPVLEDHILFSVLPVIIPFTSTFPAKVASLCVIVVSVFDDDDGVFNFIKPKLFQHRPIKRILF